MRLPRPFRIAIVVLLDAAAIWTAAAIALLLLGWEAWPFVVAVILASMAGSFVGERTGYWRGRAALWHELREEGRVLVDEREIEALASLRPILYLLDAEKEEHPDARSIAVRRGFDGSIEIERDD